MDADEFVRLVAAEAADLLAAVPGVVTPWMTLEEAARYLRVPLGTFRHRVTAGAVPCYREGKRTYFHRDELDRWRREHSVRAGS